MYTFACLQYRRTVEAFDNRRWKVDFVTIPKGNELGLEEKNELNGVLNQICTLAKFCSLFGDIKKFCFLSCFRAIR